MSSILYREGKGTIEHGIECESTTVDPHHVEGMLAAGWSANPPGYEPPELVVVDEVDDEDGEGDPKSVLAEDLESLTKQVELLTQIDANRESQIDGLNQELQNVTIERDNLLAEIDGLKREIEALKDVPVKESEADQPDPAKPEDLHREELVAGQPPAIHPVRQQAKEAGIEGWDTKRIATLENALSGE